MKRLLGLLLVMNKLETRALGGCSNITTPTRRS